ncbi:MAG TPA: TlpA disulfide reductase family protein [Gemmatimonadales bacterium]|nr:TlpA disulfide reductase family protein [Gemmatimonadales bacterium]
MSKQWMAVGLLVAGLGLGGFALVRAGQGITGVEVGNAAPDFELVDLATGDSVSLRERYRGSVTLVNIWATWCAPCREEMPAMQAAYDAFKDRGFRVAAVSIDQSDSTAVRAFVAEFGLTFDILHDRSGAIQRTYQTTGVPESFLLDRGGRIVRRVIGAHDWSSAINRDLVERLLADGGA